MKTTSEKKRIRAYLLIIFSATAVFFIGCSTFFGEGEKTTDRCLTAQELEWLENQLLAQESIVAKFDGELAEIDAMIFKIREEQTTLWPTGGLDAEFKGERKERITQTIEMLDDFRRESQLKMAELTKKLNESGYTVQKLRKEIAALNEKGAGDMKLIASLNSQLEKRLEAIEFLEDDLVELYQVLSESDQCGVEKDGVIASMEKEQNTVFVATGNFRELKDKGIVRKEPGFLGLKTQKEVDPSIDDENYSRLDKREFNSIDINAKHARLISQHPEGSYSWEGDNVEVQALAINDPDEFWKKSKYLVVEVR